MIPTHHWARSFAVTEDDVETVVGFLLDNETPLNIHDIARVVIDHRIQIDITQFEQRYKNVVPFTPDASYAPGQKLIFPALRFATGAVVAARPGNNPDYGPFEVIEVEFDSVLSGRRKFASQLTVPHKLMDSAADGGTSLPGYSQVTADDILTEFGADIKARIEERLRQHHDLVSVAGLWFPRSLIAEVNVGHLHLAEAVLDMSGGGPLLTEDILEQIGGLGEMPQPLQVLSLNYALNNDDRFDEVGPAGTVLWFLRRLEPPEVLNTPAMLKYQPIEYDRALLMPEMLELEAEIGDEWSDLPEVSGIPDELTLIVNYPHRRQGTLPLNAGMRQIFPTARRTQRIAVTLVDGQDGEEFSAWVVRGDRYVVGLSKLYRKHRLPVGAVVVVSPSDEQGKIVIDFRPHRARTEYVRLVVNRDGNMVFDEQKRAIGADYDDLMILGADDLQSVDALHQSVSGKRVQLHALLKQLVHELSRNNPQGTVHGKTLYSAVNVVRRCPPGPIFATLAASPEFEYVGNNVWKLSPAG